MFWKPFDIPTTCLIASLLVLGTACGGTDHHHNHDHLDHHGERGDGPRTELTADERYQVRYEPSPDPIPFNETFSVEVTIGEPTEPHGPVADATVTGVDAIMPSHGHGMNTTTTVEDLGEGRFRAEGLLFHMGGHWDLRVEVSGAAGADVAVFHLECCR